jgi:hypothetical protein
MVEIYATVRFAKPRLESYHIDRRECVSFPVEVLTCVGGFHSLDAVRRDLDLPEIRAWGEDGSCVLALREIEVPAIVTLPWDAQRHRVPRPTPTWIENRNCGVANLWLSTRWKI